jgi:hypothetical protein
VPKEAHFLGWFSSSESCLCLTPVRERLCSNPLASSILFPVCVLYFCLTLPVLLSLILLLLHSNFLLQTVSLIIILDLPFPSCQCSRPFFFYYLLLNFKCMFDYISSLLWVSASMTISFPALCSIQLSPHRIVFPIPLPNQISFIH